MPLVNQFGLTFNCGFCRTFVHECLYTGKKSSKNDKKEVEKGRQEPSRNQSSGDQERHKEPSESERSNEQVRPKIQDFESVFVGPRFCVKEGYFDKKSKSYPSLFNEHSKRLMKCG